jgi:carboxylesterase
MNKKIGCLIIHGFGGSLEEVAPLASHLEAEGYTVICPVLKGHTGNRIDLRRISYQDWITSAEAGLQELYAKCDQVCLIGFSMGGLIALNLSLRYRVEGVVTLNTPIYYWDIKRILLNILDDIKRRKLDNIRFYFKSSGSFPVSALFNFRVLLSKTKPLIKDVKCPIFVAQGLQDDTVRKSSAQYIYSNVASKQKSIQYYEDCGHLILWSKACDRVVEDVEDFMKKL